VRVVASDIRVLLRSLRLRRDVLDRRWTERDDVVFVWQRHQLFHSAGRRLADRLGVPLVSFVDAPVVWEAGRWGVGRGPWGAALERLVERRSLHAADVVACVSLEVADEVVRLGVPRSRIAVTPCACDLETFRPDHRDPLLGPELGLEGRFVVGWTGSFRRFHGVELLCEAAALLADFPDLALLLVGNGSQRTRVESLAGQAGVEAVFTGTVPHRTMPAYLNTMDVCVLTAPTGPFHYSPLKLHEYMGCGRPIVAAAVGEPARLLTDGVDALLVPPGNAAALAAAVRRLRCDPDLAASLGKNARDLALREGSWTDRLDGVLRQLQSPNASLV
jgi:glycosyltransferase involved in cell wall biosynthesis